MESEMTNRQEKQKIGRKHTVEKPVTTYIVSHVCLPLRFGGSVFGPTEVGSVAAEEVEASADGTSTLVARTAVVVTNLAVVPVQVLLDEVDDLWGHVVPVEGTRDGDANLVDVQADAGDALDVVERQCGLDGRGVVVTDGELSEVVGTWQGVVELLGGDALVDVELTEEVVRELLDDDTGCGHDDAFSSVFGRVASRIASV